MINKNTLISIIPILMLSVIFMPYEKVYAQEGPIIGKICDIIEACKMAAEKAVEKGLDFIGPQLGTGKIAGHVGKHFSGDVERHTIFWCDDHDCSKDGSGK